MFNVQCPCNWHLIVPSILLFLFWIHPGEGAHLRPSLLLLLLQLSLFLQVHL